MRFLVFVYILFQPWANAQPTTGIYPLNPIETLLTEDVKNLLTQDLIDKQVVFLGESEHHIGSDFLAKTAVIKYLVSKHKFSHIVFEADFFALYQTHSPENIFPMWSKSSQCQDLFKFLKENNVTIWGIDNQFSCAFSFQNFSKQLLAYLDSQKIIYNEEFKTELGLVMKTGSLKELNKNQRAHLKLTLDGLAVNENFKSNSFWAQTLASFQSLISLFENNKKQGKEIRDKQMASNLSFLTKVFPNEKCIVWAANAHISKLNLPFMDGQLMGYNYLQLHPEAKTYHIAFSSIYMPYRKEAFIIKQSQDPHNILTILPTTTENYFVSSSNFTKNDQTKLEKEYGGMFGHPFQKAQFFKHFDALVFISRGQKSILIE